MQFHAIFGVYSCSSLFYIKSISNLNNNLDNNYNNLVYPLYKPYLYRLLIVF